MPGFEWLDDKERQAVDEVMRRGFLFRYDIGSQRGQEVEEFERRWAAYTGARHALAVSSGSAALKVALMALGIGPGDEVLVPAFTFVATWESVFEVGAVPVFCDIDDTLGLDPDKLAGRITPRTKAVIAVHMLGGQADIEAIIKLASDKGLLVIEDTAQAAGGFLGSRHLGSLGAVGCFSFDAVKTLTTGEGGALITSDEALYQSACEYHDHGHDHQPVGRGNEGRRFLGFNFRMMELQGALGLVQLEKLPRMIETYRSHKNRLKEALARVPGISFRRLLDPAGDSATFLSFFMPDAAGAQRLAELLGQGGAPPVAWGVNTWHTYHNWEHLHAGATPLAGGWPYQRPEGALNYSPADLPTSKELLQCCLSWQIMLAWDEAHLAKMEAAIEAAARAL